MNNRISTTYYNEGKKKQLKKTHAINTSTKYKC